MVPEPPGGFRVFFIFTGENAKILLKHKFFLSFFPSFYPLYLSFFFHLWQAINEKGKEPHNRKGNGSCSRRIFARQDIPETDTRAATRKRLQKEYTKTRHKIYNQTANIIPRRPRFPPRNISRMGRRPKDFFRPKGLDKHAQARAGYADLKAT